jgi:hypothetical protein
LAKTSPITGFKNLKYKHGKVRKEFKILIGEPKGKRALKRLGEIWENY